ncbi:MAG: radical SAM protein [Candidatus Riflebacteria bacterium]|nr:radical SAM protein [Candidatus Riflebacteria bacterium]
MDIVSPKTVRVDSCSECQLKCPLCSSLLPNNIIGKGKLRFEDFRRILENNPQIEMVQLANKGEAFLNEELPKILSYAYEKKVTTSIGNGINLNDATDEVLEALVKFQTFSVRISIDGATQKTYEKYRIGGNLKRVLNNVQKINLLKEKYNSARPNLLYQFIIFGHNEREMGMAKVLARMLKMEIVFKLNHTPDVFSVVDRNLVKKYTEFTDRKEYFEKKGIEYIRNGCYHLWKSPQINWDGRLFGCSKNTWLAFEKNVFNEKLAQYANSEKMVYARKMLMGKVPPDKDIPCSSCEKYFSLVKHGNWITELEIQEAIKGNGFSFFHSA